MPDPTNGTETEPNPPSGNEADLKQKPSESEAERLTQWAVRKSSREGKIEVRLEGPSGRVAHFFMGWLEAYDLSNRLLGQVAERLADE